MSSNGEEADAVAIVVVYGHQEYTVETAVLEVTGDSADVAVELLQCQLLSLVGIAPEDQVLFSSDGEVVYSPRDAASSFAVSRTRRTRLFLLSTTAATQTAAQPVAPDWQQICTRCTFGNVPVVQSVFRKTAGGASLVCGPCARTCSTAFQPVHPLEWSELPSVKARFISDIAIVAGEVDALAPEGYTKLPGDLNFGADGDYVYLCVKRGGNRVITQLHVLVAPPSSSADGDTKKRPQTDTTLAVDCNSGNNASLASVRLGFNAVSLADASSKVDTLAITDIAIVCDDSRPPPGYIKIPINLNSGTVSSKTVFLSYHLSPIGGFACDSGREHSDFGECLFASRFLSGSVTSMFDLDPERLAFVRLALAADRKRSDSAALEAHYRRHEPTMVKKLQDGIQRAKSYESKEMQQEALRHIPVQLLEERARANPSPMPLFQDELVKQLLHWFKGEFFSWMNQPRCSSCNHEKTSLKRTEAPQTQEERAGGASRVEVFQCPACAQFTRFPRYNDPIKLLSTRTGRCGEWANCFTLCCRAMGFEARYVLDFTDHVWTEVYSEHSKRWLHCDSCEDQLDCPLTYEVGWGKKLSYIFSFSRDEVVDSAKRYTQNWDAMKSRRRDVSEKWLSAKIDELNQSMWRQLPAERVNILEERAKVEREELSRGRVATAGEVKGRVSGSAEWKSGRNEDGTSGFASVDGSAVDQSSEKIRTSLSKAEVLQQILKNLVVGCGVERCFNPYCALSQSAAAKIKSSDVNARAAQAIPMISELGNNGLSAEALLLLSCPSSAKDIRSFTLEFNPSAYYPLQDPPRSSASDNLIDISGNEKHVGGTAMDGALRKPFRIPDVDSTAHDDHAFGLQLLDGQQFEAPAVSAESIVSFLFRIDELSPTTNHLNDSEVCIELVFVPTDTNSTGMSFQVVRDRMHSTFYCQFKPQDGAEWIASGVVSLDFSRYGHIGIQQSAHEFVAILNGAEVLRTPTEQSGHLSMKNVLIRKPQVAGQDSHRIGVCISHFAIFDRDSISDLAEICSKMSQQFVSAPLLQAYGANGVVSGKRCAEAVASAGSGYRVLRILLWGGEFLDGIQFIYAPIVPTSSAEPEIAGSFVGNTKAKNSIKTPTVSFELCPEEFIVEVRGRKGAWTDSICLRTNFGREVRCGGGGGGDFAVKLPPASEVRAITFDVGDHLTDSIAFVIAGGSTLPSIQSSSMMQQLRGILESSSSTSRQSAVVAALRYLDNIAKQPGETKFHRIRAGNKFFVANVGVLGEKTQREFMHWCGFVPEEASAAERSYAFRPDETTAGDIKCGGPSETAEGSGIGMVAAQAQTRMACLHILQADTK